MPLDRYLAVLSAASGALAFGGAIVGSASIGAELSDRPPVAPVDRSGVVVDHGTRTAHRALHWTPDDAGGTIVPAREL